jgi:penicillin amidase
MKFLKIILGLIVGLILLAALVVGYAYWADQQSLPQLNGSLRIQGLTAPVTVYRDSIGVPHIFAQSTDDALFAQGYVTAQDRLWQMDMFRRNAKGELAEVLGESALRFDEEHCRLGFREVSEQAVDSLDAETRQELERYAAGVNAFMNSHRNSLPIEFILLRYKPRPWTPSDSLSISLMMSETLNHTWPRDIYRGKLLDKYGPELLDDLYPSHSKYEIPLVGKDATTAAPSPPDVSFPATKPALNSHNPLNLLVAAQEPHEPGIFSFLLRLFRPEKTLDDMQQFVSSLNNRDPDAAVGSNNWVVNGSHSVTGKPLLANDPHLAHSVPSIWYQAHLHTPQMNVTGVTLAGAPGIIVGHNEHIAWGVTNLNPDVQDVYEEQFTTEQGLTYLANGKWVDAQIRDQRIKIRGKADEVLHVLVTRHGPVMDRHGIMGYALKWTALQPNGIGFPFMRLNRASNWPEFTEALRGFYGPAQNFIYADDQGNIGFYDAGKIPIRPNWKGNVAVPGGSDSFEWQGYIPFEELPHLYNPPEGIIVTANQRITGDSYPYAIASDWEEPYRFARIHQLLTSKPAFSRDDFLKIQGDVYSEPNKVLGQMVVEAAKHARSQDPIVNQAIEQLKKGDFIATAGNIETTIVEHLRLQLEETLLSNVLGDPWRDYRSGVRTLFLENQLTERPARWLPKEFKNYDDLLIQSLETVCAKLQSTYASSDVSTWRWGRYYPLEFSHPLGRYWPLNRFFNVGPFEQPGTRQTVKQTTSYVGPSMRMIVDFSNLDQSVNNLTLGASGQHFSPYYSNQVTHWLEGKSYPMHFSESRVKESAVNTLVLQP